MKFTIEREALLKPLQLVVGVVERRQTLPILSNVLLDVGDHQLTLTGTDLEVEMQGRVGLTQANDSGAITVPARKLMDICRTLPEQAQVEISTDDQKLIVKSGRSRFTLTTLPAVEFPYIEAVQGSVEFSVTQSELKKLIDQTQFAMAQQDVRYYLNGMLWEVADNVLRAVATDGHRMALNLISITASGLTQVIVPRKAIVELTRLLTEHDEIVHVSLGSNQLRVKSSDFTFTSKLIDGRFPDYDRVIPKKSDKTLIVDRDLLKQTLQRVSILANEKHRGVRLELMGNLLKVAANNPDQEEAEEEVSVEYQGGDLDIGFNVTYLLDAVSALPAGNIKMLLTTQDGSVRLESENSDNSSVYVVMPMRI